MRVACLVLFLFGARLQSISAQSLFNSPEEYFGGSALASENEPYIDWYNDNSVNYQASLFLTAADSAENGAAIHWAIDDESARIRLAVAVKATGWVGMGLSETGGMQGSDVFLFEAKNPDSVKDAYVLEEKYPLTDECQSWKFEAASTGNGFLIVEVTRLLDTGDPQDIKIINDSAMEVPLHRIIAAWGEAESVDYHGLNRARGAVRWYSFGVDESVAFAEKMQKQADGFFEIRAQDYPVKAQDTEYKDFCASWDDVLAQNVPDVEGLQIIGFEPIVDEDAVRHVHHFTISGGRDTKNNATCEEFEDLFEMVYVWAPGEPAFAFPDNVGAALGSSNGGFRSFRLENHYDNPTGVEGVLDSSGVRFYYSTEKREHEMGILQVGDPFIWLDGQPVGDGLSQHTFRCPGDCSSLALQEPVTILREHLHMHHDGRRMTNELVRDGETVHKGSIEVFDFDQQGNPAVQQESFQVMPGDSFNTACYFNSQGNATFGLASQEEMCIAFLFYYPKQMIGGQFPWMCSRGLSEFGLASCDAEWTSTALDSQSDLERTFGVPASECPDINVQSSRQTSDAAAVTAAGLWTTLVLSALAFF